MFTSNPNISVYFTILRTIYCMLQVNRNLSCEQRGEAKIAALGRGLVHARIAVQPSQPPFQTLPTTRMLLKSRKTMHHPRHSTPCPSQVHERKLRLLATNRRSRVTISLVFRQKQPSPNPTQHYIASQGVLYLVAQSLPSATSPVP